MDQQKIFRNGHSNANVSSCNGGACSPTYRHLGAPQQEDILDQSSSMEHFVSSLLNDSAESNSTPGPATIQLLDNCPQPMVSSFQNIQAKVSLDQGLGVSSSFGISTSNLKDGWMKYPMPGDKMENIKPNVSLYDKALDNQRMFSGAGQHFTAPECSSYADVARGSSATITRAIGLSAQIPAQYVNPPCSQPKMVFENFVELGKPAIQVSGNPPSSKMFASLQNFAGNSIDNVNSFGSGQNMPNKYAKFNAMTNQSMPQNGYKLERGSGDVGFNAYLMMQQKNGFHKMGPDPQFQAYGGGPTRFGDRSHHQLHNGYVTDIRQLPSYGQVSPQSQNFSLAQNLPPARNVPVPPNNPFGNLNQMYQAYGDHKKPPVLPWYTANSGITSSNAMLHQASGMTGLPPVLRKSTSSPTMMHVSGFTPNVASCKDQVGVTLEGSLNGCFSELQRLEQGRKEYEFQLSQRFMGKRITSSNGIAVTPLPPDPLPVDRLICDMYKEYNRIITLTSKIGGLTREGLAAKVEDILDEWSESIQKVEGHRKAELSHTLRKLSAESVKQLYSPGNNLIAKLSALFESTREVRTALWLATVLALHSAGPCSEDNR